MRLANEEAERLRHEYLGTEHILLGPIKEGSGVAANVLRNLGVELKRVRAGVEKLLVRGPGRKTAGLLPQTPRAVSVIQYASKEGRDLGHSYVGTEHLLLGLVREREGAAGNKGGTPGQAGEGVSPPRSRYPKERATAAVSSQTTTCSPAFIFPSATVEMEICGRDAAASPVGGT